MTNNHLLFYGDNTLRDNYSNRKQFIDLYKKDNKNIEYSYYVTNNNTYELNINELVSSKLNIIIHLYDIYINNNNVFNISNNIEKNIYILYNIDILNENEQFNLLSLIDSNNLVTFYLYTSNLNNIINQLKNKCKIIKTKFNYNKLNFHKINMNDIDFLKLKYEEIIKTIYNLFNDDYSYNDILYHIYYVYCKNIDNDDTFLDKCLELSQNLHNDESSRKIFNLQYFIYFIKNKII